MIIYIGTTELTNNALFVSHFATFVMSTPEKSCIQNFVENKDMLTIPRSWVHFFQAPKPII